jgi:gliding motility-associated-like protein
MRSLPDKMKFRIRYIFIIPFLVAVLQVNGQIDEEPPDPPVFIFVTVNPNTGRVDMEWELSSSTDVAGYVIYLFRNGEGYALDTIYNPVAHSYSVNRPMIVYESESYVVAAIDSSENISPLSNVLHTIYTSLLADTCKNGIQVSWNKYLSIPIEVTGYEILVSVNGGPFQVEAEISNGLQNYFFEGIENNNEYCFRINSILENGHISVSNTPCTTIHMKITPQWINADYATVTDAGIISLSFTVDPLSETDLYNLERKIGYSGSFELFGVIRSDNKTITYFDSEYDTDNVNFYRLTALNSCDSATTVSNIASNIYLNIQNTGSEINLQWNQYHEWRGTAESYRLHIDKGYGFTESVSFEPHDTTYSISISDIIYSLAQNKICFYITTSESDNPYGINGETRSNQVCSEIEEIITIPNIFTPDGDLKNDLFKPVITFIPDEYKLVISDRQGKLLFESDDYMESWDGSAHGEKVPQGVYIWFLRLKTSTGRSIARTGTITVVKK